MEGFPEATTIRAVLDNLNTDKPASLLRSLSARRGMRSRQEARISLLRLELASQGREQGGMELPVGMQALTVFARRACGGERGKPLAAETGEALVRRSRIGMAWQRAAVRPTPLNP